MQLFGDAAACEVDLGLDAEDDGDVQGAAPLPALPRTLAHALPTGYPVPPAIPFAWNVGQEEAVRAVLRWRFDADAPRFLALTGPAGTGKTLVAREIRRQLSGTRTAWSAMTGKAALRLKDATGLRVRTFHSAIYHPPREVDLPDEAKIDLEFDAVKSNSDDGDTLLVVDEASMMSPKLRAAYLP